MTGNAGMVLEELFQKTRQIAADGFPQSLAFPVAGNTNAADDVGSERALTIDGRRCRQDLAISAVDEGCD